MPTVTSTNLNAIYHHCITKFKLYLENKRLCKVRHYLN